MGSPLSGAVPRFLYRSTPRSGCLSICRRHRRHVTSARFVRKPKHRPPKASVQVAPPSAISAFVAKVSPPHFIDSSSSGLFQAPLYCRQTSLPEATDIGAHHDQHHARHPRWPGPPPRRRRRRFRLGLLRAPHRAPLEDRPGRRRRSVPYLGAPKARVRRAADLPSAQILRWSYKMSIELREPGRMDGLTQDPRKAGASAPASISPTDPAYSSHWRHAAVPAATSAENVRGSDRA